MKVYAESTMQALNNKNLENIYILVLIFIIEEKLLNLQHLLTRKVRVGNLCFLTRKVRVGNLGFLTLGFLTFNHLYVLNKKYHPNL